MEVNIEEILGINDNHATLDLYFRIHVRWFDTDLKFHYLQNNTHKNINIVPKVPNKEIPKIWVPKIYFAYVRNSFDGEKKKTFY